MKKHDYVEVTKGLYKGLRGYIDALPSAKKACLLTAGGLYPEVRLSSLRLVPDDDEEHNKELEKIPLPF